MTNGENPIILNLENLFKNNKIELLWVKNLPSIKYLSGFTGSTAELLINADGKQWILVDGRYTTQAEAECKNSEVRLVKRPLTDLCETVKELGYKSLGFESNQATYKDFQTLDESLPEVKKVGIDNNLASLRMRKSDVEKEKLNKANIIAQKAFGDFAKEIHLGWTEKEAAWFLEQRFREHGGEGLSFDTLVCSGPRSAIVHGKPTDRAFQKGDFVIVDRGLIFDHYCSDETNTFVLGKADEKQREIYQIVLDAHDKCIDAVKPGMNCKELDAIAREHITNKGYGEFFGHGTGHGIGIEVHELPVISPNGDGWVEEGMVFSVEPGIYIPDWGGVRIEDAVIVTGDGCDLLTKADKKTYEINDL